jgi:sterol desaturase/sphingolipid hydroxylase (fatty acid hydroxylase superfamily)
MNVLAALADEAIYTSIGVAFWLASRLLPMRHAQPAGERWWNLAGFVAAMALVYVVTLPLDYFFDAVVDSSAVQWWHEQLRGLHWAPMILLYLLLLDLGSYLSHRLLHSRWLWAQHAWHHSPTSLNWMSGARGSPLHLLLLYLPAYVVAVFFPFSAPALVAIAVSLFADSINQHLIHTNLRLPWERQLERLFVTPRFHFIHHSADPRFGNSNYGFIFSFWDRLFGTYTLPESVSANEPLGLGYEASHWRLMWGLPARRRARPA